MLKLTACISKCNQTFEVRKNWREKVFNTLFVIKGLHCIISDKLIILDSERFIINPKIPMLEK